MVYVTTDWFVQEVDKSIDLVYRSGKGSDLWHYPRTECSG